MRVGYNFRYSFPLINLILFIYLLSHSIPISFGSKAKKEEGNDGMDWWITFNKLTSFQKVIERNECWRHEWSSFNFEMTGAGREQANNQSRKKREKRVNWLVDESEAKQPPRASGIRFTHPLPALFQFKLMHCVRCGVSSALSIINFEFHWLLNWNKRANQSTTQFISPFPLRSRNKWLLNDLIWITERTNGMKMKEE